MKRTLTLVIALLFILSLGTFAFADENHIIIDAELKTSMEDTKGFAQEALNQFYKEVGIDLSDKNVTRTILIDKLDDKVAARQSYDKPIVVYEEVIITSGNEENYPRNRIVKYGNVSVSLHANLKAWHKKVALQGDSLNCYSMRSYITSWTTNKPYDPGSSYTGGVEKLSHIIVHEGPDPDDGFKNKKHINDRFSRDQNPSVSGGQSGRDYGDNRPYVALVAGAYLGICRGITDFHLVFTDSSGNTFKDEHDLVTGWGNWPN